VQWDASHDRVIGTSVQNNDQYAISATTGNIDGPAEVAFYRALLPYNTSGIDSAATISSTTFYWYVTNTADNDNDANAYIGVIETTQPSHTGLTTSDYNNVGATNTPAEATDVGDRMDITDLVTSAFNAARFNSTGFAMIKVSGETSTCGTATSLTGWTCLGLREGHDLQDDEAGMAFVENHAWGPDSENTTNDPYLTIEYSIIVAVDPKSTTGVIWFD
ncbi:hypothetical protein LCGC14_1517300, partial [marine sediment metagenome]